MTGLLAATPDLPIASPELDALGSLLSPGALLTMGLVFGFAWVLLRTLRLILRGLAVRFPARRSVFLRIVPLASILVWTVATLIVVVAVFGPGSNTVAALVGASVFAVGLAAQQLFKDVLGGITILFDRPFQVGDKIEVKSYYGEVVNVGLRSTQLRTDDDSTVTVPNSKILEELVSNANSGAFDFQVVTDVFLPAHTDVHRASSLAWEAAATSPYTFLDKPIAVRVTDHFDERLLTRVRIKAYVLDLRLETLFRSDVSKRLKGALMDAGLIPHTQVI